MTSYVAVVQPGTAWPGAGCIKFQDITDGWANTAVVVEMANSGIHWMEPRDLDGSTLASAINPSEGQGVSSLHRAVSWQRTLLGAFALMADGRVRFLPTNTPAEELRALLTISGGEVIERSDPEY